MRKHVTFFVLGVQKGGTTTLQSMLNKHPQVYLHPSKEIHYFSLHYHQGSEWYESHFLDAGDDQFCGDITPYYFFHPWCAQRIHAYQPDARLIVLLRDPVQRTLSGYFHSYRLGLESLALPAALAAESSRLSGSAGALCAPDGCHQSHQVHSYLSRSLYVQQLKAYERYFSASQLLILRSEDLFEQPSKVWRALQLFLDVELIPIPAEIQIRNAGRGEAAFVTEDVLSRLRCSLEPTYRALEMRYGIRW